MQLLVRQALSGRTAVVEAAPGDTVAELKYKLSQVRPRECSLPPPPPPPRSSTHLPGTAVVSVFHSLAPSLPYKLSAAWGRPAS